MVVDTHIFLWYAVDDPRLPRNLRTDMKSDPRSVYVPSICFWEAMMLVERGRISLSGLDPAVTLRAYAADAGFLETPLTAEIAILSRTLHFLHDDPADRFIAATAKAMAEPLATLDERLRGLPWIDLAS